VDGYTLYISSSHVELTGITALTFIAKLFLEFAKFNLSCYNKGILTKLLNISTARFHSHCKANFDLYLTQHHQARHIEITDNWVRGHADKEPWETIEDIKKDLSRDEICSTWFDKMAKNEWAKGKLSSFEPEATSAERWAIFSINK